MTKELTVDGYLAELRAHLRPMTIAEREEIVREIAAHIRDSAELPGGSVESALARLGPAEELARQYSDGMLIRRASRSVSPILLMRGALRLATKGLSGVFVFFVGMIGYSIGGGLVLTALMKPIFPANTGVWTKDGVLVGSGTQFPPPAGHELLGMWYIPLALTLGSLIMLLTMGLIRTALRASSRVQSRLWLAANHG